MPRGPNPGFRAPSVPLPSRWAIGDAAIPFLGCTPLEVGLANTELIASRPRMSRLIVPSTLEGYEHTPEMIGGIGKLGMRLKGEVALVNKFMPQTGRSIPGMFDRERALVVVTGQARGEGGGPHSPSVRERPVRGTRRDRGVERGLFRLSNEFEFVTESEVTVDAGFTTHGQRFTD